jgi:hypothetical protein
MKIPDEHLLLAKGLWSVVDGTEVLADDAMAQVCAGFEKRLQMAFSIIVLAISVTSTSSRKHGTQANHTIHEILLFLYMIQIVEAT